MSKKARHLLSSAVFVLVMKDDQVCMFRRKATGWMDGSLSIPAGGLEAGEPVRVAAAREAHEEIGITVRPDELNYVHTLHSHTDGQDWLGHFLRASAWKGTPSLREPDKHSDLQWHPIATLPPMTIPYVSQALICIARGERYSEYGWD